MDIVYRWIIAPFQYPFMVNALLASLLIAGTCGVIGSYVVLRRLAFIGDALAHTALPGVVIAYMYGWSLVSGAMAAGIFTALGIGWMARKASIREDTAIGVIFTAMFALGILLMSKLQSFRDLSHILFGNILGVQTQELWLMSGVAVIVLVCLLLFHKELELTSFDPLHAEVIGIRSDRLRTMLLVLLAFTIVSSIQVVGVVLTSALLVTPAAAATFIATDLRKMMLIAAVIGAISACIGLLISFHFAVSTGAAIVLTCTALFGILAVVTRKTKP